jgi:hypothetical protein
LAQVAAVVAVQVLVVAAELAASLHTLHKVQIVIKL